MEMDVPKEPVSSESSEEQASQIFPPSLMSMPEEVLQDYIFPFLNYKELLRLRRVSKQVKVSADHVIRNNFPDVSIVREINAANLTFEHYLQLNLPTTSIHLKNKSSAIFQDPNVPAFLRLHGTKITHLKVQLFSTCVSEQELHFYSLLPNLKVLDIQLIEIPPAQDSPQFPPNFKNLKTLKMNDIKGPRKEACQNYAWNLIQFCENLEYLKGSRISIDRIMEYIRNRHEAHPELPNLRFYDMEHFLALAEDLDDVNPWGHHLDRWSRSAPSFVEFLEMCCEHGVQLSNVHSDLHSTAQQWFGAPLVAFATPIVSLRNIGLATTSAELPFLERLTIESTHWSCFHDRSRGRRNVQVPRWPKLKQVDLKIDGLVSQPDRFPDEGATINLLNFLFDSDRQSNGIQELAIRYAEKYGQWRNDKKMMKFPWVSKLTTTCPSLTKLTLENWKGGEGEEMVGFWEAFPLLEEIVLEACGQIGDEAFVGGQKAFLNLKKLTKFSLRGLYLMPKITDNAFQAVFQHLKVKQFYLTSGLPLKSVTVGGIESLLAGQFNNSVEKFPFDGWSLDGVSPEQFAQLKMRFRASHML